MRSFWIAGGLIILGGCASDQSRLPNLELMGAPEIVRPQRPPDYMRFDTARISSYRVAQRNGYQRSATNGSSGIAPTNTAEDLRIGLNGQEVLIPVRPGDRPTLSLPEWGTDPRTNSGSGINNINAGNYSTSPVAPARSTGGWAEAPAPSRPAAAAIIQPTIPSIERNVIINEVRNPSFNARRPVLVPRNSYQPATARELQRRVELSPRFQASTTQWAEPIERWLDKAAAILRANPGTLIRITGYALNSEVGGRVLAEKRAQAVATALRHRGVGSARIETEGRLVLIGRLDPNAQEQAARASRRAEIKVVYGKVEEDPFKPAVIPPLGQ